jgi:hypothetical protein
VSTLEPAGYESALLVFAQREDARIEVDAWSELASRFFETRIGLAEDKHYEPGAPAPRVDSARFVVSPTSGAPGIRSAFARPRGPLDLAAAEAADARVGFTGLALVARRCSMVWLVAREGEGDALALRLATILASSLLGPILDVGAGELFGVKTARAKIDALKSRCR